MCTSKPAKGNTNMKLHTLLTTLSILLITACGGGGNTSSNTATVPKPKPVEISTSTPMPTPSPTPCISNIEPQSTYTKAGSTTEYIDSCTGDLVVYEGDINGLIELAVEDASIVTVYTTDDSSQKLYTETYEYVDTKVFATLEYIEYTDTVFSGNNRKEWIQTQQTNEGEYVLEYTVYSHQLSIQAYIDGIEVGSCFYLVVHNTGKCSSGGYDITIRSNTFPELLMLASSSNTDNASYAAYLGLKGIVEKWGNR